MIWKDQPVEKEIEDINSKIGTVPSGKTVEGQITELNSNFEGEEVTLTPASGVTIGFENVKKFGNIVIGYFTIRNLSVEVHTNMKIASVGKNVKPAYQALFPFFLISDASMHSQIFIKTNGDIMIYSDTALSSKNLECTFMYHV